MRHFAIHALIIVQVAAVQNLYSQDAFRVKKLTETPVFDGNPFEEAWNGRNYYPMVMFKPDFGNIPEENTEVFIAYDDNYVWVAARLYMKDASEIAIVSRKRDDQPRSPDHFAVLFDGYSDKENASIFMTNPEAARIDFAVSNDAATFSSLNINWNTFWDVKTTRDDKGWYVEMRIPFSSLRFKSENNITTMGFITKRCYASNAEIDTYPAVDPKYGSIPFTKPSLAAEIEFEGINPSNPVYIAPYVIGGFSRDWILNTENTEYVNYDNPDFDAGIDMKYNFRSNMTLDITVNTDFAQVEADDQQVNLTRYSLYFPEKRMFFQERSDIFSYSLGGNANLFYSRNIGLAGGEAVRIYGGARLVGKLGKWDVGLMEMQTEEHEETPSENFGVLRLKRQLINANSYVGGIFTSRMGMDGSHNLAYGVDGLFRLFGVDYLEIKAAGSYDTINNYAQDKEIPLFLSAMWERRSSRGLGYNLSYSYSGEDFRPGIGFVNRGGLQGFASTVLYGLFPGVNSGIYSLTSSVAASRYMRLGDGNLESLSVRPGIKMQMKSNYMGEISLEYQKEGVFYTFPLAGGVTVMPGIYSFTQVNLSFSTPSSKPLSSTIGFNTGGFYNGHQNSINFSTVIDLSNSIQLSGSYQYNRITLPEIEDRLNIHVARAKIVYMLNTQLSVSAYVQYTNTTGNLVSNLRIRYNAREGNDFYLVFNDFRGTKSGPEIRPEYPDYYNRTLLLKYTHTFRL